MRRWVSEIARCACLAGLLGPVLVCGPPSSAHARDYYDRAKRYIEQGETRNALDVLRAAPAPVSAEEQARRLNGQGWIHYREGRSQEADRLFSRALAAARNAGAVALEVKILNNMGINHFVAGELDRAEEAFEASRAEGSAIAARYLDLIRRHRRSVEVNAQIQRGIGHRLDGAFDDAVTAYDRALELDPQNSDALAYRGYAHYRLGRFEDAWADIRGSLETSPNRVDSVINLLKVSCLSGTGDGIDALLAEFRSIVAEKRSVIATDRELVSRCPGVATRIAEEPAG